METCSTISRHVRSYSSLFGVNSQLLIVIPEVLGHSPLFGVSQG